MVSRTVAALLFLAVRPVECGSDSPAGPSGSEPFLGMWFNQELATRGITRVQIVREVSNLAVRMWGACVPEDCDWGMVQAPASSASDGILDLTWNQGFIVRTHKLTITQDGRLLLEEANRYLDNSGRADCNTVQFFAK